MPGFNRNEKITCDKCGTQVTKRINKRHTTRCSAGTLPCPQCPNFSKTTQSDLNYHIAKRHPTPRVNFPHKCKICFKEFSGFYALQPHKTREHGIQMESTLLEAKNLLEDNDADLKEELQACQLFLVDSELQKARHRVFNFAMSTCDNSLINMKLDWIFRRLNCAAKVEFVLKNF